MHPLSNDYKENILATENRLGYGKSFDVLEKRMSVGGTEITFFYVDGFVKDKEGWILNQIEKIKAMPFNPYAATDKEIESMKEKTLSLVVPRVEHYAKIMGLSPKKISASSAKRRFASCSSQGTLNFSFRLCNYPQEAIDYVVVHELAHMVEMNHSKRFWAVVAKYMPDYQERRKLLK